MSEYLSFQEAVDFLYAINTFISEMDDKVFQIQSTYDNAKKAMTLQHSREYQAMAADSEERIASLRKRSKTLLSDAQRIQSDMRQMDARLSSVDKYYVKTKKRRQMELNGVSDESYGQAGDYFQVLEKIRQDYQKLSRKYEEDILPALLNGLHYLFSAKRKQDYEELILLQNTVDAFVAEIQSVIPELTTEEEHEQQEVFEVQRSALLRNQARMKANIDQRYHDLMEQMAYEIDERLYSLLPTEQVKQISQSINHFLSGYGKPSLGMLSPKNVFYMGLLHYPLAGFIQTPALTSVMIAHCGPLVQNGILQLPVFASASVALPLCVQQDNTNSEAVKQFLQGVIFSFFSNIPVSRLKLTVLDFENHGNSIDAFFEVKRRMPEIFGKGICTDPDEAVARLRELSEQVDHISQDILGSRFASIFEYVKAHPDNEDCVELLVAFGIPGGLNVQGLLALQNILVYGPRCGIYTIISENRERFPSSQEFEQIYAKILNLCVRVQQEGNHFLVRNLTYTDCPMPDRNELGAFLSKYMLLQESIRNRGIAFPELLTQLLDSETDQEFSERMQSIKRMTHIFEQEEICIQEDLTNLPDYIMLGYTQYPADLFEERRYFGELRAAFPGASGRISFPLVLNLERPINIMLEYSESRTNTALVFSYHAIWRFFASLPVSRLHVCIFDPEKKGGSALPFLEFKQVCPSIFDNGLCTDADALQERLLKLSGHIDSLIQNKLGNRFTNLLQYNRAFVAYDFPSGFESRSLERLSNILRNGGKCGVYTILCHNQNMKPSGYDNSVERIETLTKLCTLVDCKDSFSLLPFNLPVTIRAPLSPSAANRYIAKYAVAVKEQGKRGIALSDILDRKLFVRNADSELSIPIGVGDGEQLVSLTFGSGSSHHALIAGGTGGGKTTLLHTIILSTMLHYAPDQIQLYLMDFKGGTEFKIYETRKLPHIRLLALDVMQEFGESILEDLVNELASRSNLFKSAGVQNQREYVQRTGQPMPRLLVIMDEFQILFNDATNRKVAYHCAELAKRIITEGRSYGIHLIMATQATKIITNLTLESGSVEQMRIRVGLKCSDADARYLFPNTDLDALEKMKGPLGTAVLNEEFTEEENVSLRVAYCGDTEKTACLDKIAAAFVNVSCHLQVFEGGRVTSLLDVLHTPLYVREPTVRVEIGTLIKVAPPHQAMFDRRTRHNTLICGANEQTQDNLFNLFLLGILCNQNTNVYCSDGELLIDEDNSPVYQIFGRFSSRFHVAHSRGEIIRFVHDIYDIFSSRRKKSEQEPVFLMLRNLQFLDIVQLMLKREPIDEAEYSNAPKPAEAMPENDNPFDFGLDFNTAQPMSASEMLIRLINDGTAYGIHVVVTCMDFQTVKECMYFGDNVLSKFPERYIFSLNDNDAGMLADGVSLSGLRNNTVVFTDSVRRTFQMKPYVFPDPEVLRLRLDKEMPPI